MIESKDRAQLTLPPDRAAGLGTPGAPGAHQSLFVTTQHILTRLVEAQRASPIGPHIDPDELSLSDGDIATCKRTVRSRLEPANERLVQNRGASSQNGTWFCTACRSLGGEALRHRPVLAWRPAKSGIGFHLK